MKAGSIIFMTMLLVFYGRAAEALSGPDISSLDSDISFREKCDLIQKLKTQFVQECSVGSKEQLMTGARWDKVRKRLASLPIESPDLISAAGDFFLQNHHPAASAASAA